MRVNVLGGGPGGLYAALLLKRASPAHEVTVYERNPPDATYGWGVVFSEQTLSSLEEADRPSHREITRRFVHWDAIDTYYRDALLRSGGHSFSGLSRMELLLILQRRCRRLGVELVFEREVPDPEGLRDCDLLIAADGVNSLTRQTYRHTFRPSLQEGEARYIWFGVELLFPAFTFIFRESEHGLFQVHAYPFDTQTRLSTFIVECTEETWRRAGLEGASEEESIQFCSRLFAPELHGKRLLSNRSLWIRFLTVRCQRWHHQNVVLLGDAAHTAHFSIGSGTRMAMEDAISLAGALQEHSELEQALAHYELERRPAVERLQELARTSQDYFENVRRYTHLEPPQFTFYLLTRSGRISYENLRRRDPHFVHRVSRWYVRASPNGAPDAQHAQHARPAEAPFRLRELGLPNRLVSVMPAADHAREGLVGDWHLVEAGRRALEGAGLILTEPAAVSAEGRITPGTAGLYRDEHAEAWQRLIRFVHQSAPARLGVVLGHAGRRGACRPRREGLDRPLGEDGWELVCASALPYGPGSPIPAELRKPDLERLLQTYREAARRALEAGFDLLELHMAHGYLLASFLSPLSNRRRDGYGGPLERRLRFPLEVVQAVREVWPEERPLSVYLQGSDWQRGGLTVEEALEAARRLGERGCDLIHVGAGQATPQSSPLDEREELVELCDRIRNESGLPTLSDSHLRSADEANTLLAAGRADLTVVSAGVLRELELAL